MTDYILIGLILGSVVTCVTLSVKFISPVLVLRQKAKTKETQPQKRKTLMQSAEDFFNNAPQLYMQMQSMIDEQRAKGATEEVLKPLLEKQKWVGRVADPRYGGVIQSLALGGIGYINKLGLKI